MRARTAKRADAARVEPTTASTAPAVPPATRSRRPGWRSPRLLLGVLLVAGSVVAGARVVAATDDSVPVWSAATALSAGSEVAADDVERRQVRFVDAETAEAYVSAVDPLPVGTRVDRDVAAGDLVPRSALATGPAEPVVEVPLAVGTDDLPRTVRQGSVVDVWVAPDPAAAAAPTDGERRAVLVLEEVTVVEVPRDADSLAPQQTQQVVLGLSEERTEELAGALGRLAEGRVVVVARSS